MESADSNHSCVNANDHDDLDLDNVRRPLLATTKAKIGGIFAAQRILMSAIAELEQFSGCDHNDDRNRGWVRTLYCGRSGRLSWMTKLLTWRSGCFS